MKIQKYSKPLFWAVGLGFKTDKTLFLLTNISSILTSSLSGIINTYLLAQATASVAQLASGAVTIRTPILRTISFGLFSFSMDAIRRVTSYYESKFDNKLDIFVQNMYASKISLFTQEQLDNPKVQESLSMAYREIYSIKSASNTAQNIVSSLIAYILAVVVVWQYAWGIGLMLSILVPVLVVTSAFQSRLRRQSWKDGDKDWRIGNGLLGYLTDPLRLFQLRIMGARDNLLKLRSLHHKKSLDYELRAQKKNTYIALIEDIISPIIDVGTRVWAIVLVAGAKLTFDQFLFVMGLINQASSQTFNLGWNISNAQETFLAASTMQELMDLPEAPDGDRPVKTHINGGLDLDIRRASLAYPNGTNALTNINMKIIAGSKVAIVGENGAGKTSLLRLLTRQYEASAGEIFIGNENIKNINRESLYDQLSVLSQDYYLLDELTIKQNLQVASKALVKDIDIYEALDVVGLKQKIEKIRGGLNARLNKSYDDGVDLSGGQRQRLAIARALLKPFNLLILDEPTSSIDAKAERAIFNSIFEKSKNSTVLIVSHRFATVRKADYIYVLDNGMIIEQGSHQELMELKGHYAGLYNIQAQDFA